MNTFGSPWLSGVVLAIAASAAWVAQGHDPSRARWKAAGVAALALAIGSVAALWLYTVGGGGRWVDPITASWVGAARPVLALDALNGILLPLSAVLTLAVVLGTPHARMTPRLAASAVLQLAATWLLSTALDLGVLAIAWIAGIAPVFTADEGRVPPRVPRIYLGGSALLLAAGFAFVAIGAARSGIDNPLSLLDLERSGLDAIALPGSMWLVLAAVMVRKGAFPFQSWIPALAEDRGPLLLALVSGPQLGAFVVMRVLFPLFPESMRHALPVIGNAAIVAGVYGAIAALGATTLRRALGWFTVSQGALLLVGLECANLEGVAGALTLVVPLSLSVVGLAVVLAGIEARVGPLPLGAYAGLGRRAPMLAMSFLILGLAGVGLPGTLGFVAEDVMVHGVLEAFPWVGVAIVLATAANGWTIVRCFLQVFHGPGRGELPMLALPRERVALVMLVGLVVALGLWPQPIVHTRELAARAVLVDP